jgi:hypothetical protein
MADIEPPIPNALKQGVHNDAYTIKGEASGANRQIAKSRAKVRAIRTLVNFKGAFRNLGASYPPGRIGFGPHFVEYDTSSGSQGAPPYVRVTYRIHVAVMYARR